MVTLNDEVDVAVIGLGVMGAATLTALARRGISAIGLERFDVPHALGSSHGGSRVIRKAYYEDPRYVPLLHRAWDAWRALEREVAEPLLVETGGLHFGPPDDADLQGVLSSVDQHALAHELLSAARIAERFPQFRPAPGDIGVFEHDAGVLMAERAWQALIEVAQRAGATVYAREEVTRIDLGATITLSTPRRAVGCRRLVLTLGPWWPDSAPLRAPLPLSATRQVQFWVRPSDPDAYRPGRFPVFLRYGDGELIYGLPEAFYPGLKLAAHRPGAVVSPSSIDRALRPDDEAPIRRFLARHLPGADGPLLGARTCMYTMTGDGHFALGPHPDDARVIVGAGFSGHGFKLAPEVGEILADYAIDGASARTIELFDVQRAAAPA